MLHPAGSVEERGDGQPYLVLHGGAGPQSVADFAQFLAEKGGSLVVMPTHPGFGGTPRPDGLNSVARLAVLYAGLLDALGLEDCDPGAIRSFVEHGFFPPARVAEPALA